MSLEAAAQSKRYLVPLLLTGVQQSPGTQGRTDKNLCRCFGAPARRVFPDHLITFFFRAKERRGGESGHGRAAGMAHGLVLVGCCGLLLAALPPTPVEHTPPCADSSPACANWAKQGECKANPG